MTERLARVDALVSQRMKEQNIPGYSLAILDRGTVIFQKPYGYADLAANEPVTNDTIFGLASLTKTFTALSLLTLVDRGLIKLDAPLAKYLDGLTPPYQNLTIRQLASMTAGVPSKLSREVAWRNQMPILLETPLASQPGSQFLYSNYSYRLLGSVIKTVAERPYLEVVREIILEPLNMESTATTVLCREPDGSPRAMRQYG
ncbi:MAG: serine hydrolase domain-containing protein [Cyanobacteriota/Melainabacteria group bacterium]